MTEPMSTLTYDTPELGVIPADSATITTPAFSMAWINDDDDDGARTVASKLAVFGGGGAADLVMLCGSVLANACSYLEVRGIPRHEFLVATMQAMETIVRDGESQRHGQFTRNMTEEDETE